MKKFTAWKLDLLDCMSADRRLTATDFRVAFRVFSYMDSESGNCFPRQETIATDLGVTDRTVRNALANLRACGWLKSEERQLPKGRGKSNYYHFRDATTGSAFPVNDTTTGSAVPLNDATSGKSARDFRKTASAAYKDDEHVEENTLNRESAKRVPRARPLPDNFKPDQQVAHAAGMEQAEAQRQAALFLDHHRAKGTLMRDWAAAWRNWIRRVPDFTRRPNGQDHQQRRPHIAEQAFEAARQAHEREQNGGLFDDGVEPTDGPAGYLPPGIRH